MTEHNQSPSGTSCNLPGTEPMIPVRLFVDLLDNWQRRLRAANQAADEPWGEHADYWLDRELFGAARFLSELAYQVDDVLLLGRATKVLLDLQGRFQAEHREVELQEEQTRRERQYVDAVTQICIRFFFRERLARVDMSKYVAMVDAARVDISDASLLRRLEKYVSDSRILSAAYVHVKGALSNRLDHVLPTQDNVLQAFESFMEDIWRKADQYVPKQIAAGRAKR